jgi:protein-disulfide isomerase
MLDLSISHGRIANAVAVTTVGLLLATGCQSSSKSTRPPLTDSTTPCSTLRTQLCGEFGNESEMCETVKSNTEVLSAERCQGILAKYPDVVAQLKKRQESIRSLSAAEKARLAEGNVPSLGSNQAPVTLVAFLDFQCPFCAEQAAVLQSLSRKYGDRLRVVFRQFPLPMHSQAEDAAEAALAAHAQGKFWGYQAKLFAQHGQLDRDRLESAGREVGLDMKAFKKALDTRAFSSRVQFDLQLGVQLGIQGTPVMFLNGKRLGGGMEESDLALLIERALEVA